MIAEKSEELVLNSDLTIHNIEDHRKKILSIIDSAEAVSVNLSRVRSIDISGLQLMLSLFLTLKKIGKSVQCTGEFSEELIEALNMVTFTMKSIDNGRELTEFIKETI